mgnify:FL=1|tara:strand:+ start:586 stop:816 length:231 start_codon:yes stop_codon:yes gene_type:complete
MSVDNDVIGYEEILCMYDDICNKLHDRPELLEAFRQLVRKGDMNYEPESSSSDEDVDEGEAEVITVQKKDGFYSLA